MKTWICIGDSNTYGFDPRNFWGGRYDTDWVQLTAQRTGLRMVNLGQNGREIPDLAIEAEWLDRDIRRSLPADGIAVMLGTNDVLVAAHPNAQTIAARMEGYLRHLRETWPDQTLLLIAPPPVRVMVPAIDTAAQQLPAAYEALAKRMNIAFASAADWALPLAHDGVHLTEEAHAVFAERIAAVLAE